MTKESMDSSVDAVMQESFGYAVANRFYQLLDDESDPLDILWEAERQQWQHHSEAGARGAWGGGGGWREPKREWKQPGSPSAPDWPPQLGQKRAPKQGEQQGFNNRGADVKQDKTEWRTSVRHYRSHETEGQAEFAAEMNKNLARNLPCRPTERFDHERPIRGRGRGRGGMRGRGRGIGINRSFYDFGQRGKQEFQRQSGNYNMGMKADNKKDGGGACNWGSVKEDTSGMEQYGPMEEAVEKSEKPGTSEGEPLNKAAEGEPMEEVVQEVMLDEWKNLQRQNRPKPEFNIRKPASTVPSEAAMMHKSKYRDDLQRQDYEDDSHVFRRPVNDITSQLAINFGSLPCPGRGSRGARGGRGCGRQVVEAGPRQGVVDLVATIVCLEVQLAAPNPDDSEDFLALA